MGGAGRAPSRPGSAKLRPMRLALPLLLSLMTLGGSAWAEPSAVHFRLSGPLDVGTLGLLQRATSTARELDAPLLVVEINTPGGEVGLMIRFARQLEETRGAGVRTVAWIHGEATSAGALVALACDSIYMSGSSHMGSATPVTFGPAGMAPLPEEGGVREKVDSVVRSEFRAVAQDGGRSGELAEAMVDADLVVRRVELDGEEQVMDAKAWSDARVLGRDPVLLETLCAEGELLSLTAHEAVELGMSDGVADSLSEVLQRCGLPREAEVRTLQRSNSEDLLAWLAAFSPLLIGLGVLLGYAEIKTQGFGLFGILALACFALVFTGRYFVGLADVPHLVLLVLGLALIGVELFLTPGQLWPGILGGLLAFGSLVAMDLGTDFDWSRAWDRSQAWQALSRMVWTGALSVGAALVLSRFLPETPGLRRMVQLPSGAGAPAPAEDLVGAYGGALTDLRPVGKVALDASPETEREASAEGAAIDAGARVLVVEVHGPRLLVRDAREDQA